MDDTKFKRELLDTLRELNQSMKTIAQAQHVLMQFMVRDHMVMNGLVPDDPEGKYMVKENEDD